MTPNSTSPHIPVLLNEVVTLLLNGRQEHLQIIDGTLGYGGHSAALLNYNHAAELLGIDRDVNAINYASNVLEFAKSRIHLIRGEFSQMAKWMSDCGWAAVDAILLDVGVSSPQLDIAQRGFSHRLEGPLDMRMDDRSNNTAGDLLNHASIQELTDIFRTYGEIKSAYKLAQAIVERRQQKSWDGTLEFANFCNSIIKKDRPSAPPPATLCFQALRIAVNDELNQLKDALKNAISLLRPNGRIAIISFHSLEDRIVKQFFSDESTQCHCPPGLPECRCGHIQQLKLITKKPVIASEQECKLNPRASCAKLRVAEKL